MTTPKTSKPESKDEKKKSPEAERAVVKPKAKKEQDEKADTWKGGVDHFSERV